MTPPESRDEGSTADDADDEITRLDAAVSVPYKVLGQFSNASDGVGVLGYNTATNGTTRGVEGRVDSSDGYGLYTPDDAKVGGTIELSAVSGSLTGGTPMNSVTGEGLSIDGDGTLNGHVYRTNEFTSAGTTWSPISVSNETRVGVTVDTNDLGNGRVRVDVDGSRVAIVEPNDVYRRIVSPSTSVAMESLNWWGFRDTFDVSSQLSNPSGVAFKSDGTRMFVIGLDTDRVFSYSLSTAWDVSTASVANDVSVSGQTDYPMDLAFHSEGTKLFVVGLLDQKVYSYDLSTKWDVTTASFNRSFAVSSQTSKPRGLTFGDSGSKMFVVGSSGNDLYAYSLSSSWDLSTASFAAQSTLYDPTKVPSGPSGPRGVAFDSDGSKFLICDAVDGFLYVYSLSKKWDVTTTTRRSSFHVESSNEEVSPTGITLKPDDTELYVTGAVRLTVDEFDLTYGGSAYASVRRE